MVVIPGNIGTKRATSRGVLDARARRMIWLTCWISAIGRAADQHEPPIAITAIDIALIIDLQPHARMAKRGGNAIMRTIASDSGRVDAGDFGWRNHEQRDSNRA